MKRFWLIALFSLTLPLATQATGPSVYVDLGFEAITITDGFKEKIIEYDDVEDLQAVQIERDGQYYFVILRFKGDVVRLYLYDRSGAEIDSQKVMKAKDAKDFSAVRLIAVTTTDGKKRIQVKGTKLNETGQPVKVVSKRYIINPSAEDPIAFNTDEETDITYPSFSGLTDQEAGMALFNYHRQAAGLFPIKRLGELDVPCYKHAYYMKTNQLLEHYEDPELPGYTEEGDIAGGSSNIARDMNNSMVSAIERWLNGTYHRFYMIESYLTATGFGIDGPSSDGFYYTCLDISTQLDGIEVVGDETDKTYFDASNVRAIHSPGVNQINVPTTFTAGEWPDPLYKFNGTYPAGYPITVTPGMRDYIDDLYLQLYGPTGEKIFAYWQPPGDSEDPNGLYQGSSYSLIPASPLAAQTKYKVKMTGTVNDQAYTKEWYFTTE